jgi:hypothetical protein
MGGLLDLESPPTRKTKSKQKNPTREVDGPPVPLSANQKRISTSEEKRNPK